MHLDSVSPLRFWVFFFLAYYVYSVLRIGNPDQITDCDGCWELNSGLLEEQSMLLIFEPSFQP